MKQIEITADINDADYITSVHDITDEEIKKFKPLIQAIKDFKPYKTKYKHSWPPHEESEWTHHHNWPTNEICRTDLGEKEPRELYKNIVDDEVFEIFDKLIPYNEYGIHTITSIVIKEIINIEKLL